MAKLKRSLGSLYTLDPLNPSGHYRLDLAVENDGKLLEKLLLISNEEGAYRSSLGLPDTSQSGLYDCFRNETHNGKPLKKKFVLETPRAGVVEFDFTSVYLHGKCRNGYDGTPYLPSGYQLQALCAALPRAPEPSEYQSFHNLRLVVKPYLFTVKQAQSVLRALGQHASIQTEAFIVLFGRIVDIRHMHVLFAEFNGQQRLAIFSRIGILNAWSPLCAVGPYELKLEKADQRKVAAMFLELGGFEDAAKEVQFQGKKYPTVDDAISQGGGGCKIQDLKKGKLSLLHAPEFSDWDVRKRLVMQTLAGDELMRPLVAEAFNTGEADQVRQLRCSM